MQIEHHSQTSQRTRTTFPLAIALLEGVAESLAHLDFITVVGSTINEAISILQEQKYKYKYISRYIADLASQS